MIIVYSVTCHATVQDRNPGRLLHAQPHLHVAGHAQRHDPDPVPRQDQHHGHEGNRARVLRQCLQRYTQALWLILLFIFFFIYVACAANSGRR